MKKKIVSMTVTEINSETYRETHYFDTVGQFVDWLLAE